MKTITLSANSSWYLFNFRKNTILSLIEDGYKVICISPQDPYAQNLINIGCDWYPVKIDTSGANPWRDLRLIINFFVYYLKFKPIAAFHFTIKNNVYGTLAAFMCNIPSINNISGLGTAFLHEGLKYKIAKTLYRISLPLAAKVFCQNDEDFALLTDLKILRKGQLKLLPGSGVDLLRFHPRLKDTNNKARSYFRFIYSGRFLADKGLRELIEAIKQINNSQICCELYLIGFQDSENISAIQSKEITKWSHVPGVFIMDPTDKIEMCLAQSDCLVLPSYREGMPRSILEACAMEIPIVCSDVPGCRNIVTHLDNGLLCEPKDSQSLEHQMRQMLKFTPQDRHLMGVRGRKKVLKCYDESIVIKEAKNAILEVAT